MPEIFVGQETQVVSQELYDELLKTYAGDDSNECCAAFGSVGCGCTRQPRHVGLHVAHASEGLGIVTVVAIWDDLGKVIGRAALENHIAGLADRPLLVHTPCADPERGEHAPEGW